MVVENTNEYASYLGTRNALIVAPHAGIEVGIDEKVEWETALLAKSVSDALDCSYIVGMPYRNKEYAGSHNFNKVPVDYPQNSPKWRFRQKTCWLANQLLLKYGTVYVLNIHTMRKTSIRAPKERHSAVDIGTGGQRKYNRLEAICEQKQQHVDNNISFNTYFKAQNKANAIHWFNERVHAVQLEIRVDYSREHFSKPFNYIKAVLQEL